VVKIFLKTGASGVMLARMVPGIRAYPLTMTSLYVKIYCNMKIYLDNCAYNRPFDDQSQIRISLEVQAKLHIQRLIIDKKLELVYSYLSVYENSENPNLEHRNSIRNFFHYGNRVHRY
jgi:hypothetical protein